MMQQVERLGKIRPLGERPGIGVLAAGRLNSVAGSACSSTTFALSPTGASVGTAWSRNFRGCTPNVFVTRSSPGTSTRCTSYRIGAKAGLSPSCTRCHSPVRSFSRTGFGTAPPSRSCS